ncbi:DUF6074 family protein [Agrobacterium sp. rho-8.1]|nr:DUF6074 family protein [Agrobacterium sp. rho-8.1]
MTERSEVIAFPAKNRVVDIKRCVQMLEQLNGEEANLFWRSECRTLAAHLTGLGYDELAMRQEIMDFQGAVQAELWSASQQDEPVRRETY